MSSVHLGVDETHAEIGDAPTSMGRNALVDSPYIAINDRAALRSGLTFNLDILYGQVAIIPNREVCFHYRFESSLVPVEFSYFCFFQRTVMWTLHRSSSIACRGRSRACTVRI